ncbi:MAG: lipoprotein signal peptidase [Barnesiella sp.]|nr:lipoprotein signal peptidase [Barnesiella sp.]MBD5257986.1 lipoprotein signal peptidase [Barnesiella sp.]
MTAKLSHYQWAVIVAILVVVLDQILKIWVKTSFYLGQEREITSWFRLCFIENNGMAFGWQLGSKIFLTLFRVAFVGVLVYYLVKLKNSPGIKMGYLLCVSLVIAGALGNIIDCMFYGLIFNDPMPTAVATMFPEGGGYAPFLQGRVVDMLSFPLFSFNWPDWVPVVGGEHFEFFKPIFNLADAAISCGIIAVILFYSKQLAYSFAELKRMREEKKNKSSQQN